ncbi:Phosphatase and actin regulator 3 [Chelonia mydas]|uniref:Phosphatase and actin regulator n=1 Tax=Chelonia mydas TaxID=8469 RepID=M7BUT5_CHEMY|nr:Phosphatase and actin regulator 3 [Chelonia mydas]
MEQSPAMHSEYLVSGIRTPPVRRNSKLATLGRIFKPWKWRKKKNEKLKQTSADAGGKTGAADGATRSMQSDPSSPVCQALTSEEMQQESTAVTTNATSLGEDLHSEELKEDAAKKPSVSTEELEDARLPVTEETPQALLISESTDSPQKPMERNLAQLPSPPSLPIPPPKAISKIKSVTGGSSKSTCTNPCKADDTDSNHLPNQQLVYDLPQVARKHKECLSAFCYTESQCDNSTEAVNAAVNCRAQVNRSFKAFCLKDLLIRNYVIVGSSQISGQAALFHPPGQKGSDPHVRGQLPTPTGSPHPAAVHLPLPPSRVIEELHRALATKHRQDSFHGRESKGSPKKRVDVRPSRTSSIEGNKEKENALSHSNEPEHKRNSVKESDENKENLIMNSELKDNLVFYQDEEVLNDSIISGTLPRKCKKELLAVKLRNRPSKQELEDRNIFPRRTDEERQEIRQQIEMKLSKRLSQRPAVEELERRNILKQRNDQTEQEERREIKQRLTRKLNQRPTVDELRDRKILIRFSDYVEVAKAQDYDRRADKPWTRLSAADKVQTYLKI